MFRITLICELLPVTAGEEAARDITKEFADHRQWHRHVTCKWDGTRLILRSESDCDSAGLATLDEFGDCVAAYVADLEDSRIYIESVSEFNQDNASP